MSTFYLVLLLASWIHHSSSQCYNPDGSEIAYQPCFPSDQKTHCCDVGTTCLSTGLCLVKSDSSFNTGKYSLSRISTKVGGIPLCRDLDFRHLSIRWDGVDSSHIGGCTDPTWNSVNCFSHCKSSQLGTVSTVYRCSNNNWCCSDGANSTSCCHDPHVKLFKLGRDAYVQNGTAFIQGYNIAPDRDIIPSSPSSSFNGSLCTATAPAQSFSQVTVTGVGVGLGVGVPLLAAISVLSFLLLQERRRSRNSSAGRGSASSMVQTVARTPGQLESPRVERQSSQAGSSRTGFGEPPNSQFADIGDGQRRNVHELHEEHLQVAELPNSNPMD
jgi:hypothetical protein